MMSSAKISQIFGISLVWDLRTQSLDLNKNSLATCYWTLPGCNHCWTAPAWTGLPHEDRVPLPSSLCLSPIWNGILSTTPAILICDLDLKLWDLVLIVSPDNCQANEAEITNYGKLSAIISLGSFFALFTLIYFPRPEVMTPLICDVMKM